MKTYTLHVLGQEIEVVPVRSHYTETSSLAVIFMDVHGNTENNIVLTKNLDGSDMLPEDMAYVNSNSGLQLEQLIAETGIARKVPGAQLRNGFCTYPLYRFDLKKLTGIVEFQEFIEQQEFDIVSACM